MSAPLCETPAAETAAEAAARIGGSRSALHAAAVRRGLVASRRGAGRPRADQAARLLPAQWDAVAESLRASKEGRTEDAQAALDTAPITPHWDGRPLTGLRTRVRVQGAWVSVTVDPVRRYSGGRVLGWRWSAVCELVRAVVEVRGGRIADVDLAKTRAVEAAPRAASAAQLLTEMHR